MGTTYCDAWRSKSDVVKALKSDLTDSGRYMIVGDSTVGNVYYSVIERIGSELPQDRVIMVCLLSRSEKVWGYKDMDETMGPYYYTCPAKLIKLAGPTSNAQALAWREACKRHADRVKAIKGLKTGDVVKLIPGLKGTAHESLTHGTVVNLKPLAIVTNEGDRYRLKSTMIAEVLGQPSDFVRDHIAHVKVG